jgi:hypothetical protein
MTGYHLKGQIALPWLMLAYASLLVVGSWADLLEEGITGRRSPGKTRNLLPTGPSSGRFLARSFRGKDHNTDIL